MTSYEEIERKYDVGKHVVTPDLHELPAVTVVSQPRELTLDASYFDTSDLALARAQITLRRRSGGDDEGWHLKIPRTGDSREEVRLPLTADNGAVPAALLDRVRAQVLDHALLPVARICTRRIVWQLLDDNDVVLAEFCDDHVTAERLPAAGSPMTWREWELELIDGDAELLEAGHVVVLASGAAVASEPSKLARVLGTTPEPTQEAEPLSAKAEGDVTTRDAFLAYVGAMVERIREHDPLVRQDAPDAVHQMRVALRRLRSVLATYRPVLGREQTDALRDELKWSAGQLALARDSEVMLERFDTLVSAQPAELVLGGVTGRIDRHLRGQHQAGLAQAEAALDDERYFRLLDSLVRLSSGAALTAKADDPAAARLPHLLKRDWKRLRRRMHAVDEATDRAGRDRALHEVRKAAKRLRYAADSAVPALGVRADELSGRAEAIQDLLGEHQDTTVARGMLRTLGVQAHLDGDNGFTFGRLHALEECRSDQLRSEYADVVQGLPAKQFKRWLRT